ncbi:MAG: recombinase family protein [Anaerolineae bacterium]|nr:recombinase family protein [Candidatus Roseilinea sp.]MDW8448809.1 recombinase family protein [Anaerolineae bacterium]
MIRVRCYYRYSSDEQSDSWSIEAQDKACRAFIAAHPDWMISGQPYIDEAYSGKTVNRPAFQQMLSDARSGQFDVLVCHKLDRFSRSLVDVLLTLDELQKHNVSFASATEAIDFTTPSGRMMLVMLAFFAEWYLQNLSAETTKGKLARFEAGYWNGDLRFGYSKMEVGQEVKNGAVKQLYKPVPNADARFVVLAYELCAAGYLDQEIADRLNQEGARTYRLLANAKAKATPQTDPKLRRPWVKDSVAALFNREAVQFYLGNILYIGEKERKKVERQQQPQIRKGTHDAIINPELAERALAMRAKRATAPHGAVTRANRTYLFGGGIAACSCCGKPLRCTNSKRGEQYLYYRCASWLRGEPCAASRQQIREQLLEPQIDRYMRSLQLPEDWRKRIHDLLLSDVGVESLQKRRDHLRAQLRRLNYQFEHGLIDEEETATYTKHAQKLIREINSIVIPSSQHLIEHGEQLLQFCDLWGKANKQQRHAILREIFEAVYVDTNAKTIVGVKPYVEFVPMFRQTRLIERDCTFILEESETARSADTAERSYVQYGSDGIRIIIWIVVIRMSS